MSAIGGRRANDAKAKAQEVMYEAWNQTSLRARVALAHKARLFIGIAALVAISTVSEAADGCGRGMFYNGRRCVPQDGPGYGPPPYQRGYGPPRKSAAMARP